VANGGHRGTTRTFLQAAAPRVRCPEHGVQVAHVPWARPGAKCTYLLEDTCAWLVKNMALSAVAVFLRLSWQSVSGIGIDEISYRKGHRYAWWTMTRVGWCGLARAGTRTP
jgi:transposase